MTLRVATWNVNSIRTRLPSVLAWLERRSPDVLCMQETKVEDEAFPRRELEDAGWRVVTHGEKGRNGVAIVSRHGLEETRCGLRDARPEDERRIVSALVRGVHVVTVYVPNGQAVGAEAYFEKIQWMVRLRHHLAGCFDVKKDPVLVCGDWNVAPRDQDIWDPRLTAGLHCSKAERDAYAAIAALGLEDAALLKPPAGFTWWSYTPSDFKKDRGMRIDLVLVSKPLAARLESVTVDREERSQAKGASDHAPLIAAFAE